LNISNLHSNYMIFLDIEATVSVDIQKEGFGPYVQVKLIWFPNWSNVLPNCKWFLS